MIRKLLYTLNRRAPVLFAPVRFASGLVARIIHGPGIRRALAEAEISGDADERQYVLRPLDTNDLDTLQQFLTQQQAARFSFFRPHGFDRKSLRKHLRSAQFLSYGLFENDRMIAYGLIRITPTRSAFVGSMVAQSHGGRGVGKLMARYLYWQTAKIGLDNYLTISGDNPASLKSHSPDRKLEKIQSLNNQGYALYRAPRIPADDARPALNFGAGADRKGGRNHGL